jgi:hypothetical protein
MYLTLARTAINAWQNCIFALLDLKQDEFFDFSLVNFMVWINTLG